MWVLYVVWAFSAPEESRVAVYADRAECMSVVASLKLDHRVERSRCVFREDWQYRY